MQNASAIGHEIPCALSKDRERTNADRATAWCTDRDQRLRVECLNPVFASTIEAKRVLDAWRDDDMDRN